MKENYLVIGLGRSGIAVANFLLNKGKIVYIYDKKEGLTKELVRMGLINEKAIIIDKLCAKTLCIVLCIVLSPGVKLNKKELKLIEKYQIKVIGELAFASHFCNAPMYAVTGTNGKTTTVNFLNQILKTAGMNTHLLGNVGTPLSSEVEKILPSDKVILEVSSFQLEYCTGLKFNCAGFINIAPDHLDRYANFNEYFKTKQKILDCVDKNGKIFLNYDDALVKNLAENRENVEFFSLEELPENKNGLYIKENKIFKNENNKVNFIADLDEFQPKGKHNLQNLLCAVGMAVSAGVAPINIQKAIPTLITPSHRIEFAGECNGVKFYNDSKATNTDSVLVALKCFTEPLWLLLGGSDKSEKFDNLIKQMPKNVVEIVAFGQTGKKIYKTCKKFKFNKVHLSNTFYDAFNFAKDKSRQGEVVLLSPACASFDEFANFEERGKYFCNLVSELNGEI